nr:MAG TPA: hypothetical protein [Caudoviricetes sp.]
MGQQGIDYYKRQIMAYRIRFLFLILIYAFIQNLYLISLL